MKRWFFLFLLLPLCLLSTEKRAYQWEDYYRFKRLSDLAISPQGDRLAFVVTTYDLKKAKKKQTIWMMKPDGSQMRQLTRGSKEEHSPVFSPDGKLIAFISNREGKEQLYTIPVDGGEAKKITDAPFGLASPQWFPKGDRLLITARVFPECEMDMACQKETLEAIEEGPLHVHMADALFYRHWNFWKDERFSHILVCDLQGNFEDLTPGAYESPIFSIYGGRHWDIDPSGQYLVFSSKRVPHPAESTNGDLYLVSLEKKNDENPENLTPFNPADDRSPKFSPDGRYIAYRSQKVPGYESDLWRLTLLDLTTKKVRYLTDRKTFDYWVNDLAWGSDAKTLYFTAQVKGDTPMYQVDLTTGKISHLFTHQTVDTFVVSPQGDWIYFIHRAIQEPWEIYRFSLKKRGKPERITFLNKPIEDEVDLRPAERHDVKGAEGRSVQVFLIKPHDFDPTKKYPAILNVHGGPQGQWQDSFRGDWQLYPGSGYVLAFPNPHGSTGFGQAYTEAISGDWGGKVYEDVMKVADWLANLPFVDKERMGAMGWSYGGYMMNWLLGHTQRFKAIASMMGVYDLPSMYGATEELWFPEWDLKGTPWESQDYTTWNPSRFVKNFKTPTLVITGEKDFRVPYTQSLQLFTALQKMRVPSRLIVFPEAGHWPGWIEMAFYYLAHLDWFHTYLGGAPPPYDLKAFRRNKYFEKED